MAVQFCPNRKINTRIKTPIVRVLRTKEEDFRMDQCEFVEMKTHKVVVEPKQLPKTGDQSAKAAILAGVVLLLVVTSAIAKLLINDVKITSPKIDLWVYFLQLALQKW